MNNKSKQMQKEIFCLIPARSKSKRIKNKNILKIKGFELIIHTIKFAKKFKNMEICFSTDSKKYKTAFLYSILYMLLIHLSLILNISI